MSVTCSHGRFPWDCREDNVGYVPPEPPMRLNLDRHGMPRDYATYVWLLYGKRVEDNSPARLAFLNGPQMRYATTTAYFTDEMVEDAAAVRSMLDAMLADFA